MKRWFFAVAVCLSLSGLAQADPVPKHLKNSLRSWSINDMALQKGVLKIRTNYPTVTQTIYESMMSAGACSALWLRPKNGWGNARIERIEILNQIARQGFVFFGGRKACQKMGEPHGTEEKRRQFWKAHTLTCVAGVCSPQ